MSILCQLPGTRLAKPCPGPYAVDPRYTRRRYEACRNRSWH